MACDIDEIGGMYHGAVAAVRRNRADWFSQFTP